MTDFSDQRHSLAELAFQGATELDPNQFCKGEVIDSLETWRQRPDHESSGADLLRVVNCSLFSISYQGEAGEYWPNESENDISETLIREFLYRDGICTLTDERVHLIHMKYSIMAMTGDEYVLVCPFLTAAGNISGIVVVCVTKMILGHA
ncbi:MAG: hypothetical protein ACE5KS_02875 [Woeseiaceae bacterium]